MAEAKAKTKSFKVKNNGKCLVILNLQSFSKNDGKAVGKKINLLPSKEVDVDLASKEHFEKSYATELETGLLSVV